jgi:hypothetical protein
MKKPHYRNLKWILENESYLIDTEKGIILDKKHEKRIGTIDKTGNRKIHFHVQGTQFHYYEKDVIATAAGWDIAGKKIGNKNGDILDNRLENLFIK